jgi:pyrroline-5-carboxylate reductase
MQLGFIGAGNMASALARGIGEPVLVSDPDTGRAEALVEAVGGEVLASNAEVAEQADAIVLCHKPWQLEEVAADTSGKAKAVVSILGATRTSTLEEAFPGVPVYRFIPSIPAEVRRGVLCYAPGSTAKEGPEDEVLELFGRSGMLIPLGDEELIEPAMALMSSGVAFVALVAEAFAEAGAAHGLERDDALRMAVETMGGTAAWAAEHDFDLPGLRTRVATPGGVTEKGLDALEERGLRDVVRGGVDAVVEATK